MTHTMTLCFANIYNSLIVETDCDKNIKKTNLLCSDRDEISKHCVWANGSYNRIGYSRIYDAAFILLYQRNNKNKLLLPFINYDWNYDSRSDIVDLMFEHDV